MRKTKRRLEPFTFFNQTGISAHLEKMAEKGWMIEKLTNTGWVYRRIEPKRVKFAVSYYPKASEFDPEPTEGQKMFHEFCAHTGWTLACTSAQMQFFYNEQENPVPIETEPELELEAIHASAKKSFFPTYIMLLILAVLQGAMLISSLLGDPISVLSSPTRLFSGLCWLVLFLLCTVELLCYFRWYGKAQKAADQGEFLNPPNTATLQKVCLAVVFGCAIYYAVNLLFSDDPIMKWVMVLMSVYMVLLFVLVNATKEFLKKQKASRGVNRTVTILTSFVLSFSMMGAITYGTLRLSQNGFFAANNEETYEHNGTTWVIHNDELPLTVEDLMEVDYDGYIRERRGEESILMGQLTLTQRPRFDAEDYARIPSLEYTMTIVKLPFLYEMCKEQLIRKVEDRYPDWKQSYVAEDAAPWGANEVYRRHDPGYGFENNYLLCYDNVLVEIRFDAEPTEEQMKIVGEKLGA